MAPAKEIPFRRSIELDSLDQITSISSGASDDGYIPETIYDEQQSVMRRKSTASTVASTHGRLLLLRTRSISSKEQAFNQSEILKEAEKEDPPIPKWKSILQLIYPHWFINSIRSWDNFKVAFRTFVAIWLALVFVLIHPVHVWLQRASFLAMIVNVVLPAGDLSISEAIITSLSVFLGVIIGWLHSVIAMAISMRIRKVKFNSQADYVAHLIKNGICENNPKTLQLCIQSDIFHGNYLEAKSSAIFAIAMGFAIMLFFLIRMKNPMKAPLCILSTIPAAISCSYCNLFPFFGGVVQLCNILIRPFGLGLGLIIVTSIFIFPTTSLYKYLKLSTTQMNLIQKYSADHIKMMNEKLPSHEDFGDFAILHKTMTSFRGLALPISIQSDTIRKEFYFMRLSPDDICKFNDLLSKLGNTLAGIEYFYMNLQECKKWIDYESNDINDLGRVVTNIESNPIANYERSKTIEAYKKYFNDEVEESNIRNVDDLDYIMHIIIKVFLESFETAHGILGNCTEWLEVTNNFRLSYFWPGNKEKYNTRIKEINETIVRDKDLLFKQSDNIIKAIENSCMLKEKQHIVLPIIGQVSLFEYIFKQYIEAVDDLCKHILEWDKTKPTPRFFFPFVYLFEKGKEQKESELEDEIIRVRNPDAIPYNTPIGKFLNKSKLGYNYVMRESRIPLGMRTVIVTILCNFMAYFPNSVYWYYGNRIIWVPIMVCISVSSDSYDSAYQLIGKVTSTLGGAIIAAFAWYISTGSGQGNPFGLGAVCGVLFFFAAYYRHFSVHITPMPAIVPVVTLVLVIGTSWQDARIPTSTSLGWGIEPAYARFVCVFLGTVVAFLVSIFPHVSTGSKRVRVSISNVLRNIARIHCQIRDLLNYRYQNLDEEKIKKKEAKVNQLIRTNLIELTRTTQIIKRMKYEPNLSGKWPKKKYDTLIIFEIHILKLYFFLLSSFDMIEDPQFWVPHISNRLGWIDDNLTSDLFSVIYMCSASLKEGFSLPRVTPSELSLKHLSILTELGLGDPFYGSDSIYFNGLVNPDISEDSEERLVNIKMLLSKGGRCNMVSLILIHLIYEKIDLILVLTKSLVGEEFNFEDFIFNDNIEEMA